MRTKSPNEVLICGVFFRLDETIVTENGWKNQDKFRKAIAQHVRFGSIVYAYIIIRAFLNEMPHLFILHYQGLLQIPVF